MLGDNEDDKMKEEQDLDVDVDENIEIPERIDEML